jgi:NADH-quinone oxidoreductase subunit B
MVPMTAPRAAHPAALAAAQSAARSAAPASAPLTTGTPAPPGAQLPEPLVLDVWAGGPCRLTVLSLGLACCALEVAAAALRPPSGPAGGPPLRVLVVAGTVTDRLAPAVLAAHRRLRPDRVVSFGACSNTGGPYWDSYAVTKGVDQLLPVDRYVPGCPPRPEALIAALAGLWP